ncbi:MAG: carboxylesterase family protein [Proteobacteria bacterium]|nr:carboxylesterase family protein [Pseudomonadota bacterium]
MKKSGRGKSRNLVLKMGLYLFIAALIFSSMSGCKDEDSTSWQGEKNVFTRYGRFEGVNDSSNTFSWRGIPFAKPPVGALRWKAPQAPIGSTATRSAAEFGDYCPQYAFPDGNLAGTPEILGNEDCLYLNVWRPNSDAENLPVYFWIHGGGNSIQSPMLHTFTGSNLASTSNMVVVTINYRLGPLGWLSHPALRGGASTLDDSGNFGTLDSIRALEWVKNNIEYFGGNPDSVTVAGESAGASNTLALMISPLANGLFHRAIVQSGGSGTSSFSDGETHTNTLVERLLVADGTAADGTAAAAYRATMTSSAIETYLRSKTSTEIIATYTPGTGGMISFVAKFADGAVLPTSGFGTFDDGTYANKVPIILGTNKEETKLFSYFSYLAGNFADDELYNLVAKYGSDMWKVRGVDSLARKLVAHQAGSVFTYQFLWGAGGANSVIAQPIGLMIGSCHGLEIDFFFGNDDGFLAGYTFSDANKAGREELSDNMMAYASQFARTGDPSTGKNGTLTDWEAWSNTDSAAKGILLDADLTAASLNMTTAELTAVSVATALDAEPRAAEIKAKLGW